MTHANNELEVRLDKWLWAARIFKTRTLAKLALEHGRVRVDGQRSRPSRHANLGMMLSIARGDETLIIKVLALSATRGDATTAQQLYQESEPDRAARLAAADQRRLARTSQPTPEHRPDKKQRRTLQQLKQQN